jgi:mono/diheme cytochrome c family protein
VLPPDGHRSTQLARLRSFQVLHQFVRFVQPQLPRVALHKECVEVPGVQAQNLLPSDTGRRPSRPSGRAIGTIDASDLTPGKGGAGSEFTDANWVLAIRHGINPEGKPLLIMPSSDLYYLGDQDFGEILAYVKSLPPVDKEWPDYSVTPLARILVGVGALGDSITAESIDHTGPRPVAPPAGVTAAAYGGHLVKTFGCASCHGKDLSGGKDPNPAAPPAPDLMPRGELRLWTQADFITAVRTRVAEFMPWKDMRNMTDDELKAVWLDLQSLPTK